HEVVVGLAGRGKSDLDLLEAHAHQQVEHDALALRTHRVDERLVTIAKIDGTPAWRLSDPLARPGAVREVDVQHLVERTIFVNRHGRWFLRVFHGDPAAPLPALWATVLE